jgi:hypothetical protein
MILRGPSSIADTVGRQRRRCFSLVTLVVAGRRDRTEALLIDSVDPFTEVSRRASNFNGRRGMDKHSSKAVKYASQIIPLVRKAKFRAGSESASGLSPAPSRWRFK